MKILLGNVAPVQPFEKGDPRRVPANIEGETITEISAPTEKALMQVVVEVTHGNGVWERHSDAAPSWVSSDTAGVAEILAAHYGCEIKPFIDNADIGTSDIATVSSTTVSAPPTGAN